MNAARAAAGDRAPRPAPERVAVVGSGVAGLLAAHVLAKSCHVTLYEADTRLGGHADTHDVGSGAHRVSVDTGFIVHNERTYPQLLRLFADLGIETQDSEMSMSVRDDAHDLEWAGALGVGGLFPTWRNLAKPAYLRMLAEIPRFHRMAKRLVAADDTSDLETLGSFLDRGRFSSTFRTEFMESLVACVWSTDPADAPDYPARYLFRFLEHHGMLGVFGSPRWRTVTGGSRGYVERVAAGIHDVRTGTKVTTIDEAPDAVRVTDGNGATESFDAVVVAAHPHQALAMLAEPTAAQREVLGAITYSPNTTRLHTDESLLPRHPRARASWNYRRRDASSGDGAVTVTYDLTRLMRLPVATEGPYAGKRMLVTLGGSDLVDPACVIDTMQYEHPLYTPASVAAQRRLPDCDTDRVVLAGAWHGWGFHEDGARSGVDAARRLGVDWEQETDRPPPVQVPALYATEITHTRRKPWRRTFTQRNHTWLVDLDELPDHGWLGTFEGRDHVGDPEATIRDNVASLLARHGLELDSPEPGSGGRGRGRVLMAANARAFGYCFNPISVHWCHAGDGELLATVVEVHNTYGDRHAYLVHPDAQGRASVDKAMYVSPFHSTDGRYELAVPVPGDRLDIAVTLRTGAQSVDGAATFSAALRGRRTSASPRRAAPAALLGSLQIRLHGIWLWLRRLPVRPRPPHQQQHHHQEGVR